MDWTLAIDRNSMALKHIVASLFAMAGLSATPTSPLRGEVAPQGGAGGGGAAAHPTPDLSPSSGQPSAGPGGSDPPPRGEGGAFRPTLPRRLHRAVLRLLRPAESAMRRLIVIAARGLVVPPSPLRPAKPKQPSIFLRRGDRGTGIILPRGLPGTVYFSAQKQRLLVSGAGGKVNCPLRISLPLFDPLKRPFRRHRPTPICEPRISYPGPFNRLSPVKLRRPPSPDDRLDATRLALRINALAAALDDLPGQARRLARWRANRAAAKSREAAASSNRIARHHRRLSPLRPGRPPGFSRRLDDDTRDMLTDLHGLAYDALEQPDTS